MQCKDGLNAPFFRLFVSAQCSVIEYYRANDLYKTSVSTVTWCHVDVNRSLCVCIDTHTNTFAWYNGILEFTVSFVVRTVYFLGLYSTAIQNRQSNEKKRKNANIGSKWMNKLCVSLYELYHCIYFFIFFVVVFVNFFLLLSYFLRFIIFFLCVTKLYAFFLCSSSNLIFLVALIVFAVYKCIIISFRT